MCSCALIAYRGTIIFHKTLGKQYSTMYTKRVSRELVAESRLAFQVKRKSANWYGRNLEVKDLKARLFFTQKKTKNSIKSFKNRNSSRMGGIF